MNSRKKTVLHVVGAMNLAGVETVLMNVLRNINSKKFEFVFLCYIEGEYAYEKEINELGAKIVRIEDQRISNPLAFVRNIERVIIEEQVDIVHSHVDFTSAYAMLAAHRAGISKRIVHAHSTSATKTFNLLKKVWFVLLKKVLNIYSNEKVSCGLDAGKFMFKSSKFNVYNNGVDSKAFRYSKNNRIKIRNKLNIDKKCKVFLHVGRFEDSKNHTFLIDIFNSYLRFDANAKLILIGQGSMYNKIEAKIKSLGIKDSVFMLGSKEGLYEYYSAADLYLMPSKYEGLPVSLIEAQMSGLTCLISENIDKSVIYNNVICLSLSKSAKEWAQKIAMISIGARQVNKKLIYEYSIKNVVKRYEVLYES
jgi:glycosyltransferase involved in cell wall biosynthesis